MKYLPFIIALLLLIAACGEPESETQELAEQLKEEAAEPPAEEPKEPEMQVTEETEQEEQPAEEPQQEEQTQEEAEEKPEQKTAADVLAEEDVVSPPKPRTQMYRFLDAYAEKVKSYEFIHKRNKYFVKNSKIKVILASPASEKNVNAGGQQRSIFYYDTVYLDRSDKSAVAYCEGHESLVNRQCTQYDLYDLPLPVSFENYNIVLPEDWLFSFLNREPSELDLNKYYINGRTTAFAKFEGDPIVELSIDPSTGLIIRADQIQNAQILARYEYEKLAVNGVRDVDVIHRSKDEIPSEEAFYR